MISDGTRPRESRLRPRLKDEPESEAGLLLPIAVPEDGLVADTALEDATAIEEAALEGDGLKDAALEDAAIGVAGLEAPGVGPKQIVVCFPCRIPLLVADGLPPLPRRGPRAPLCAARDGSIFRFSWQAGGRQPINTVAGSR